MFYSNIFNVHTEKHPYDNLSLVYTGNANSYELSLHLIFTPKTKRIETHISISIQLSIHQLSNPCCHFL